MYKTMQPRFHTALLTSATRCEGAEHGPIMRPHGIHDGPFISPPPRYPQDHSFLARTSHTCSQCSVFVNFSITTLLEAPNTSVRADVRCGRSAHLSPRPFMPPHPSYPHHGQPPHRPPQSHRPPSNPYPTCPPCQIQPRHKA
jgi:hypothetical protein